MGRRNRAFVVNVDGEDIHVPRKRERKMKRGGKPVKKKFLHDEADSSLQFQPIGKAQILGARFLREGRKLVVLQGPAGGGKSILSAWHAANLLKENKINKLYLVRPYESCGRSIGAVPGTEREKLAVIFTSIVEHLTKFLGKAKVNYMLEKGIIEFKSVEWMRGASFEDGCFVLCEESQGFDVDLIQMLTTRIGDGAQLCLTGDERQKDIKKRTGLSYLNEMIQKVAINPPEWLDKEDIEELTNNVGFVNFTFEDSGRRSKLTKALVKLFYFE